jgi:hypothetical protein
MKGLSERVVITTQSLKITEVSSQRTKGRVTAFTLKEKTYT